MARKHFPSLNEYAAWVAKQPAGAVLGTAFDGVEYPYEAYLSEYYGTSVVVIAGDCYEMNNRRYDLPTEWDGFTVGYHDSDLSAAYEAADGPQSGIEVTTEIEMAYLHEMIGSPAPVMVSAEAIDNFFAAVPQMAVEKLGLSFVARCQFHGNESTTLYAIQSGEKLYTVTVHDGKVTGCAHNDETCTGYSYRHTCKHTAYVAYLIEKVGPMVVTHPSEQEQLAEAAAIAPAVLGEMAQDLDAHVEDTLQEVLVFMDPLSKFHDFGTVLISGEPAQYLWIEQIREQYPVHRVISRDEYLEFKQREAEKYRAMFPGDFYDAA